MDNIFNKMQHHMEMISAEQRDVVRQNPMQTAAIIFLQEIVEQLTEAYDLNRQSQALISRKLDLIADRLMEVSKPRKWNIPKQT